MKPSPFSYCNDVLCAEAVPLVEIAQDVPTPFFCASVGQLQANVRRLSFDPDARVDYALRAKTSLPVIRALAEAGAGACVRSAGELAYALEGDMPPARIVLGGFRRNEDDITAALLAGLSRIRIGSFAEMGLVERIAEDMERTAPLSLRIDLGLGPSGGTDLTLENLAGALGRIAKSPRLSFAGLSVAAPREVTALDAAYRRLVEVVALLRAESFAPGTLELGEIQADTPSLSFADWLSLTRQRLASLGCALRFEAGEKLLEKTALHVVRVLGVRREAGRTVVALDADPWDIAEGAAEILPLRFEPGRLTASVVLTGPSGEPDPWGGERIMPFPHKDELLAVLSFEKAGRFSFLARESLWAEVFVSGADYALTRRSLAPAERMGWEAVPDWMGADCAA